MKKDEACWVVIHIAHSEEKAAQARELLQREGFLIQCRRVSYSASGGDSVYEVLALSTEAREARRVLVETGL